MRSAEKVLCSATHLRHRLESVLLCERDAQKVNTPLTAACSGNNRGGAGTKVETMNLSFLFYTWSALQTLYAKTHLIKSSRGLRTGKTAESNHWVKDFG